MCKFLCKNRSWYTCSDASVLRCAVTISPAVEKTLSAETLVPGIHKYLLANLEIRGNIIWFLLHQLRGSSESTPVLGHFFLHSGISGHRLLLDSSISKGLPQQILFQRRWWLSFVRRALVLLLLSGQGVFLPQCVVLWGFLLFNSHLLL